MGGADLSVGEAGSSLMGSKSAADFREVTTAGVGDLHCTGGEVDLRGLAPSPYPHTGTPRLPHPPLPHPSPAAFSSGARTEPAARATLTLAPTDRLLGLVRLVLDVGVALLRVV